MNYADAKKELNYKNKYMEQNTTITLDGVKQIDPTQAYMVDWTKMSTVNDLVLILASLGMAFPGNHPNIEMLKPFLNLDNPIPLAPQPPVQKEIKLPKIQNLK